MNTQDDILAKLLDLTHKQLGERALTLQAGDDIYEALELDSLQAMDLLTALEAAFGVEIPDYELADVRTLASIADLLRARL